MHGDVKPVSVVSLLVMGNDFFFILITVKRSSNTFCIQYVLCVLLFFLFS